MWLCDSSVGRKVVMSVTGIALVLFLTFHMGSEWFCFSACFFGRGMLLYTCICMFVIQI